MTRLGLAIVAFALGCGRAPDLAKKTTTLTDDECDKLKVDRGTLFPTCDARVPETEAVWPAKDDPPIPYPTDPDAARDLCQNKFAWFLGQEEEFEAEKLKTPDLKKEVCFGVTRINKQEVRSGLGLDEPVFCFSMYMHYAPVKGAKLSPTLVHEGPFSKDAVDAKGRLSHFSPCRNKLFVQCALDNKLAIDRAHVRWTLGPMDPVGKKADDPPLDTTFKSPAFGDISFTTQEMCMFREWTGKFPEGKRFREPLAVR